MSSRSISGQASRSVARRGAKVAGGHRRRRNAHRAGQRGDSERGAREGDRLILEALCLHHQRFAFGRQRPAARQAVEEPQAQRPLERLDAPRHRRMLDIEASRGSGQAAQARKREEVADIVPLQALAHRGGPVTRSLLHGWLERTGIRERILHTLIELPQASTGLRHPPRTAPASASRRAARGSRADSGRTTAVRSHPRRAPRRPLAAVPARRRHAGRAAPPR